MDAINSLLTEYSLPAIIIILILVLVAVKFLSELIIWFYEKAKNFFKKKNDAEQKELTQDEQLNNHFEEAEKHFKKIDERFDEINEQILISHQNQDSINERLNFMEERQQENTRSFLIDAHHKFCYEVGQIDDWNLQSIERRYMYYKTAGGNSFIDGLVAEIRELPRAHLEEKHYEFPPLEPRELEGKDVL